MATITRRAATALTALALGAGLAAATPALAGADPGGPSATCTASAADLDFTRQIVGATVVKPGETITFQVVVSNRSIVSRGVMAIQDLVPDGLNYVADSSRYSHDGGATWKSSETWQTASRGKPVKLQAPTLNPWYTGSGVGKSVTFTWTYRVPADFRPGTYRTGYEVDIFTWQNTAKFHDCGAVFTVVGAEGPSLPGLPGGTGSLGSGSQQGGGSSNGSSAVKADRSVSDILAG